jgi:hypothetical protein
MGDATHNTVRPDNVDMDTKRERLRRDLVECESVTNARDDAVARNGVVFESDDGDIEPDVMRVLSEHNAFLSAEQPSAKRVHGALIHLG